MFFLVFKCKTIGIKKWLSKKPKLRKGITDTDKVSGIFLFVLKKAYFEVSPNKAMKVQFKALPSHSPSLFPEDIFSRIPENHPVRLVNEVVDKLDIGQLIKQYKAPFLDTFF